ncbi:hypothetical protein A2292_02870 [candidate division WOR-1 bacterium RIFOXYB2_FULL_46_45]|nr:MAG: hypothetical protein A2292_02870 [candidate division WOR-1 bacterium RIFOXYB2_FULL_46_45]
MELMFKYTAYFNAAISFFLGFFVYFNGPTKRQNILLFLLSLSISLYAVFFAFSIYMPDQNISLFAVRIFHVFCLGIATFLCLFSNEIIFDNTFRKAWHYIPLITMAIVSYFLMFGDVVRGVEPVGTLPNWTVPGSQFILYFIHYGFFTTLPILLLLFYYFRTEGAKQNQIKLILIGAGLALLGGWTTFLPGWGIKVEPYGIHFIFIFQFILTYAILKYQLMNIRATLSKIGAFLAVSFIYCMGYVFLAYFYVNFFMTERPYGLIAASLLYGLISGFSFNDFRLRLQTKAERAFIVGWYDFNEVITQLTEKLFHIVEATKVFEIIKDTLKEKLEIDHIIVFAAQKDENLNLVSFGLLNGQKESAKELNIDHPFIKHYAVKKPYMDGYDNLAEELKRIIETDKYLKGTFYLPIYSSDALEGVLILGKKASEDSYTSTDLSLFKAIIYQSISIFDRIRPYEKIKKEYENTQKKLYDTDRLLARSEKIVSMANLIQEYNHEIKTPLGIMRSKLYLLPDDAGKIEDFKSIKEYLREQIDRANDIVESTLRLSRPKEHHETALDLNTVIEYAVKMSSLIGIHLTKELGTIPKIMGDKDDLQMVFMNLLKNAAEAMPDGGDLKIKTYAVPENGDQIVCAEISDTGCGIPKENMEKIFEPFFSTHVTKGRGLGLSIVFRIIREHLGKIDVSSKVGTGSTFKIVLPIKIAIDD